MEKRKVEVNIEDFPQELHPVLNGAHVYDSSCGSAAKVYYFDNGYYLKVDAKDKLQREAELAKKFFEMGMGVEVAAYISEDRDYMLTKGAEGDDATHFLRDPKKLCQVLATAMRTLHSRLPEGISESPQMQGYMCSAEGDYRDGEFVEYIIMDKFKIGSRQEAWQIMQENKHKLKCDTLIHGDFCLPNVMVKDGQFHTFIDVGLAGAGDKHVDLYWALWSLQFNLKTEAYTDYFLDMYGRENFDEGMLRVVAAFECFGE